jgi:hypothetical protein
MISRAPLENRISHLVSRLFFRGIYFPQMNKRAWMKLIAQNRRTIFKLTKEAVSTYRAARKRKPGVVSDGAPAPMSGRETTDRQCKLPPQPISAVSSNSQRKRA